jgi:hypothetical protein
VHPDLARPADLATGLFYKPMALLLLGDHLLIGDLRVRPKVGVSGISVFL